MTSKFVGYIIYDDTLSQSIFMSKSLKYKMKDGHMYEFTSLIIDINNKQYTVNYIFENRQGPIPDTIITEMSKKIIAYQKHMSKIKK